MSDLKNTHQDTIDCVVSFSRQPNKLIDYLSTFNSCTKTASASNITKIIEGMMEREIEKDIILQPEIHLFDVTSAVGLAPNPVIKDLLKVSPTLTLCLIKLNFGVLPVFVDAFFCDRNSAFIILKNLESHLDQYHRAYHIEYHGVPHKEMLQSLHDGI